MNGRKRRLSIAAGVLAVAAVLSGSQTALAAARTYDDWGTYRSSDVTSGSYGSASGQIEWINENAYDPNKAAIFVSGRLYDNGPGDGKGPWLLIDWSENGDVGRSSDVYTLHNTFGAGTSIPVQQSFSSSDGTNNNDAIRFKVCNGGAAGAQINCSGWGGWFHN